MYLQGQSSYAQSSDPKRLHHRFQMASHGEQNNEQHQHQRNEQARLHRLHFPLTYSSCHRPEAATDDQIPALEAADQEPSA